MNFGLFVKKTVRYFSCAVKYAAAVTASPFFRNKGIYRELWLISERGIDARDNGYYFFRYVTQNYEKINTAYVISRESADYDRVAALGRVIPYGSFAHYLAVVLAKVKISTHIMGYTPYIDFFAHIKGLVKGKKVFLQHGITKDNIPYLYKKNTRADLFVCAAKPEYDYVKSVYGYEEDEVRLLGFCRYDELYKIERPSKKILVMPTWRHNLIGIDAKHFTESEYFKTYDSLLKSERLNSLLESYGYELLFYPHIELQKFVSCFDDGERVKIISFKDRTVQDLLINTDILITDFSSVFFDYAYMEKPMIFYQFDESDFRREHYGEGYFSYKKDAFGAVLYSENEVLDELESILKRGAEISDEYLDRINKFFTLRDTNNCERNFRAVCDLLKRG